MSMYKNVRVEYDIDKRNWEYLQRGDILIWFQVYDYEKNDILSLFKVDAIWNDKNGRRMYRLEDGWTIVEGTVEELQAKGFVTMQTVGRALREYVINTKID